MPGPAASSPAVERSLLRTARDGDESAYQRLVEPHRRELHAHCYRMLGSVHDAEDALQEALVRAWRNLGRFEGRSALRSWLYSIATNACLDAIKKRKRRVLPPDHGPAFDPTQAFGTPLTENTWVEPYAMEIPDGRAGPEARYEQRESLELAFVATLQHLPSQQRAALILREVLGFSARETAETLGTSVPGVNSALQRARATLEKRLPERSQQVTLDELGDRELQTLVGRYSTALEEGDTEGVIGLLTEDATWSMPPTPTWFRGLHDMRLFLAGGPFTVTWRHLAARANGQVAVAGYVWDEDAGHFGAYVLDVLTLRGDRIAAVTAYLEPDLLPRFGLPESLPADAPAGAGIVLAG